MMIGTCKHLDDKYLEDGKDIYTVFIVADADIIDICEDCYVNSNVVDQNSPNDEASYTSLYNEWDNSK